MEYYAKTKKRQLSLEEKAKLKEDLEKIKKKLQDELDDTEINIINHTIDDLDKDAEEKQKTLKEHEEEIVRCAETFFKQYGAYFSDKEKLLILEACKRHDWGKANLLFQALMFNLELDEETKLDSRKLEQIPHGFLSAVTISKSEFLKLSEEFSEEDFSPFITAIYYHHDREDDYDGEKIREYGRKYYMQQVSEYLNKDISKLYCSNIYKLLFRNNLYSSKIVEYQYENWSKIWNEYLLIKGMLNKFDYTVSAGYEEAEIAVDLQKQKLKKSIEKCLEQYELKPAQQFMMEHKDESLVVVAPTGSGKTEAALLWLNGEKGFYTLPLKVSSNAIYNRVREKYSYEDVALLHSDSMAKYLKEYKQEEAGICEKYDRAKMLSQPLTVCTVDQLFKFVYRALGTEIFAATLKYSKLIIDEIQAYEPRVIATIVYGLSIIQKMGGKFAIITATFSPVLQYFMKECGLEYSFEDFTSKVEEKEINSRHIVEIHDSDIIDDSVCKEILEQGKHKKVLVICNTVLKAQQLYKMLKGENVWLLHSRYLRRDRALLEKNIMEFSESDKTGVWITTQIVEASLDIDFDVLYTEMSTADSLLQRMGRCNRKGRYCPEEANIHVYANKNGVGKSSVYENDLYERALECLKKHLEAHKGKPFTEKMKTDYMNKVYNIEEIRNTKYFKEIETYLNLFENIHPTEYLAKEAEVRNINSITIVPERIYQEKKEVFDVGIEFLSKPNIGRETRSLIKSKLQDLTLSLPIYQKFPEKVDKKIIGNGRKRKVMDIHRATYKYEFDFENGKGMGLIMQEELETDGEFI
ncbi:CRISPR-associated helicase Cas3' [Blautia stercoris]|uniref:CRISPR-associated helicase Cas3' n=1 Tax=Blautia stercoris TaxID=871664 RepID=UPI00355B6453